MEVDKWFRAAYGAPPKRYEKQGNRHPMYAYNVANLGIAVQYGYDTDEDRTFIVGVKSRTMEELISAAKVIKEEREAGENGSKQ